MTWPVIRYRRAVAPLQHSEVNGVVPQHPGMTSLQQPAAKFPTLGPGLLGHGLRCHPPDYGRVVEDLGASARVHFVSPEGYQATVVLGKMRLGIRTAGHSKGSPPKPTRVSSVLSVPHPSPSRFARTSIAPCPS